MIVLPDSFYTLLQNPYIVLVSFILLLALAVFCFIDASHRASWKQKTFIEMLPKTSEALAKKYGVPIESNSPDQFYNNLSVDPKYWKKVAFVYDKEDSIEGKRSIVKGFLFPIDIEIDPSEKSIASYKVIKRTPIQNGYMESIVLDNGVTGYISTSNLKSIYKANISINPTLMAEWYPQRP